MNKKHRKILSELCGLANEMGGQLDYTATSYEKLKNRQKQLMNFHKVLYGVLVDVAENDSRDEDLKTALIALEKIKVASQIIFPDRNGEFKQQELNHPNKYNPYEDD